MNTRRITLDELIVLHDEFFQYNVIVEQQAKDLLKQYEYHQLRPMNGEFETYVDLQCGRQVSAVHSLMRQKYMMDVVKVARKMKARRNK